MRDFKEVVGRFLLKCNFDVSKLPIRIPAFYKESLDSWPSLVRWTNETTDGVLLQQTIWNNKFVLIENKSVYYSRLLNIGLVTIGDVLSSWSRSGSFLGFDEFRQKGVTPSEYLE